VKKTHHMWTLLHQKIKNSDRFMKHINMQQTCRRKNLYLRKYL